LYVKIFGRNGDFKNGTPGRPVDQKVSAVDQPRLEELNEGVLDSFRMGLKKRQKAQDHNIVFIYFVCLF
jgi:hypothetical protein